jgi:hypothetical protein
MAENRGFFLTIASLIQASAMEQALRRTSAAVRVDPLFDH